jgi:two-component system, cell cycle response regulator
MAHEHILVVDDSPIVLEIVSELLKNNGFKILTANNGVEAIERAFKEQPDLIILDVLMPKMNGYQVCRLLKSDPETFHIPIIILTVKDRTCDKYWGSQLGADGYLSKEFEQTVLLKKIHELIQKKQKTTSARSLIRENSLISAVDVISKVNDLLDKKLFEATVLNEMSSLIEKGVEDFKSTLDIVMDTLAKIVGYNVGIIVILERQNAKCFITINHTVSEQYLKEIEEYIKTYLKEHDIYYPADTTTRFNTDKLKQADDVKEQEIAFFDVPIRHANRLRGLIILAQDPSEKMEGKETEFFKTAIKQAYIIIENSWLYNKVKRLAITDSLTGIYNHGFLYVSLCKEYTRAERNYLPLSLLMLDIDYFKKINDTYGHRQGDVILYELSQIFKNCIRKYDILGRYGGEEFSIILPETDKKHGIKLAERIRRAVEEYNFGGNNKIIKCTVSIGVSSYPTKEVENVEDLIFKADKALYRAKTEGRNRVYT